MMFHPQNLALSLSHGSLISIQLATLTFLNSVLGAGLDETTAERDLTPRQPFFSLGTCQWRCRDRGHRPFP